MSETARCILGAAVKSLHDVRLPCFASFKLDGIRARWWEREFMSRTFKTLPNRNLQAYASQYLTGCTGWDGEIVVGDPTAADCFRRTESFVNSRNAAIPPDGVRFFTFDHCLAGGGFAERVSALADRPPLAVKLNQVLCTTYAELEHFESYAVSRGYEGVITRSPTGKYKHGRSTIREQYLLKVKRFEHAEATVIGFEELLHNANPAERDERGYTKRSSHAEGKVPAGVLGALIVDWGGKEFRIGTGFSSQDRREIWLRRDNLLGKTARFKYLPVGAYDLPRHPVFDGWRTPGT